MPTRYLALMVNALVIMATYGCTQATSYVKPTPQESSAIRHLAVTVAGKPEFSHIGAVASESISLVILFGALGAIADTAGRRDMDAKTAAEIKPKDFASNAHAVLASALVETLQQSQRFDDVRVIDSVGEQSKKNCDAVLEVRIVNWGSRIKQSGSDVVMPFIELQVSMIRQSDNKVIWSESQTVAHDTHHTLDEYKQQDGLFGSDFMALANKAGRQVGLVLRDL